MFAQERQQKILEALKKRSRLLLPELEALLEASPATVRRDLSFLESVGKVVRTHGGVLLPNRNDDEVSFDRKGRREHQGKIAIAKAAAELVKPGESVFVDSGTTAFELGRRLLERDGITVFTNSVPLLTEKPAGESRLVALGGEVRLVSLALVGSGALEWMRRLRFDFAFIGASGIDAARGPCTTELSEAGVKGAAIEAARRAILLVDASKWLHPAPVRFAEWCQIDDIFTDHEPTAEEAAHLASNGVTLRRIGR